MKTRSKVKSVQGDGTWQGSDGTTFYKFDYVMEDGTALQASHKTQSSFNVGDDVDYEVKRDHETYGKSGTVGKPSDFQQGQQQRGQQKGKSSGNVASFALSYAKDLAVAGKIEVDQVMVWADTFNKWLKSN